MHSGKRCRAYEIFEDLRCAYRKRHNRWGSSMLLYHDCPEYRAWVKAWRVYIHKWYQQQLVASRTTRRRREVTPDEG